MESGTSERYVDERICCEDQDQDLGCPGYMVIYEPSPCGVVHLSVDLAIDLSEQEALDDIVTYEEVIGDDDAANQRTERGKTRD